MHGIRAALRSGAGRAACRSRSSAEARPLTLTRRTRAAVGERSARLAIRGIRATSGPATVHGQWWLEPRSVACRATELEIAQLDRALLQDAWRCSRPRPRAARHARGRRAGQPGRRPARTAAGRRMARVNWSRSSGELHFAELAMTGEDLPRSAARAARSTLRAAPSRLRARWRPARRPRDSQRAHRLAAQRRAAPAGLARRRAGLIACCASVLRCAGPRAPDAARWRSKPMRAANASCATRGRGA